MGAYNERYKPMRVLGLPVPALFALFLGFGFLYLGLITGGFLMVLFLLVSVVFFAGMFFLMSLWDELILLPVFISGWITKRSKLEEDEFIQR